MAELAIVDKSVEKAHVSRVLRRHASQGELDDIRGILPDELRLILS